ncbi:unknown [[Mannheimia] succiniciproducens MBEL55E]|uniref:Uncharacterized protein n=1 Tax=Mannheimia succiniciproducens (strain KCTC 0769BP / MBEL55E) TaxID=221988 RepID=Q65VC7_MANSM|nr:unknown [[Mannheimia] succiniciproducens MBEL55E]
MNRRVQGPTTHNGISGSSNHLLLCKPFLSFANKFELKFDKLAKN